MCEHSPQTKILPTANEAYSLVNSSPRGQSLRYRILRRIVGRRIYSLAKATKVAWPLSRASYSQDGEDLSLLRVLGGYRNGMFLDIGAGNPVHLSNSYLFYRLGWCGTCVEPLGANHLLSRLLRPRDHNVRALTSSTAGWHKFFELDPSYYSTVDVSVAKRCLADGVALVAVQELQTLRVSDLPFEPPPGIPSFMTVDVEGHEHDVLLSVDWGRQRPWLILVELWDRDERATQNQKVRDLLHTKGYVSWGSASGQNHMFAHESVVHMLQGP